MPHLRDLDRTGELLRSRATDQRYEHPRPGDLFHVETEKLGRIPDGGRWRLTGANNPTRTATSTSRWATVTSRSPSTTTTASPSQGPARRHRPHLRCTCQWFRTTPGITVRRVLTDNALANRRSHDWAAVFTALQVKWRFTKPGDPCNNGKGRALQPHAAHRLGLRPLWFSIQDRTAASAEFLERYNNTGGHTAAGGRAPVTRLAA